MTLRNVQFASKRVHKKLKKVTGLCIVVNNVMSIIALIVTAIHSKNLLHAKKDIT